MPLSENIPKDADPEDYTFVSTRHFLRKQKILSGQGGLAGIVGQPGPIAGVVINTFDLVVNVIAKIMVFLLRITQYAFNVVHNFAFGNFDGLLPNSIVGGKVLTYKYPRYIMTVLLPPIGVFMGKGLYGTFNVFVCLIITYVNYFAGIIYAFIITNRNRYADQYEKQQYTVLKARNPDVTIMPSDSKAFSGLIGFIIIVALTIAFFFYYF